MKDEIDNINENSCCCKCSPASKTCKCCCNDPDYLEDSTKNKHLKRSVPRKKQSSQQRKKKSNNYSQEYSKKGNVRKMEQRRRPKLYKRKTFKRKFIRDDIYEDVLPEHKPNSESVKKIKPRFRLENKLRDVLKTILNSNLKSSPDISNSCCCKCTNCCCICKNPNHFSNTSFETRVILGNIEVVVREMKKDNNKELPKPPSTTEVVNYDEENKSDIESKNYDPNERKQINKYEYGSPDEYKYDNYNEYDEYEVNAKLKEDDSDQFEEDETDKFEAEGSNIQQIVVESTPSEIPCNCNKNNKDTDANAMNVALLISSPIRSDVERMVSFQEKPSIKVRDVANFDCRCNKNINDRMSKMPFQDKGPLLILKLPYIRKKKASALHDYLKFNKNPENWELLPETVTVLPNITAEIMSTARRRHHTLLNKRKIQRFPQSNNAKRQIIVVNMTDTHIPQINKSFTNSNLTNITSQNTKLKGDESAKLFLLAVLEEKSSQNSKNNIKTRLKEKGSIDIQNVTTLKTFIKQLLEKSENDTFVQCLLYNKCEEENI